MNERKYKTASEVLARGREVIGIPIGSIDKTGRIDIGKGAIGSIIEESWFGYVINSDSVPDFPEAGVELKVTPYVCNANGFRAKERLVCNIIDYMTEYRADTLYESSFWRKCNLMLLMTYKYQEGVPKSKYIIDHVFLFRFPPNDRLIIESDWKKIHAKIMGGKAHELSEGDTLYLGACTKGVNSMSARKQPFSEILAKQRAYCLKTSYMTTILRTNAFGNPQDENIIKSTQALEQGSFEQYLTHQIEPYIGKSKESLMALYRLAESKRVYERIVAKILGITGQISSTEEFRKAGIIVKTIHVKADGKLEESVSFPSFKFDDIVKHDWEESEFYEVLSQSRFMFVVFRRNLDDVMLLEGIHFWNMPYDDLAVVGDVYARTRQIIREGVKTIRRGSKVYNNFPKESNRQIAHVRPHGSKASYEPGSPKADILPDGTWFTKQAFWLNKDYIWSQIFGGDREQ